MPIMSFMVYNLFNTINMYSYLLLTRSLVNTVELCIFRKFTHFIYFLCLCAVLSFSTFSYKFYHFIPSYLHLATNIVTLLTIFIFTKYSNQISWLKAFLSMVVFISFSIILDALVLYGASLLDIDLDTLYVFLQYFACLFYASISFSIALLIAYYRNQKQKNKAESTQIIESLLPDLKHTHYFFVIPLFIVYVIYQLYIISSNVKHLSLTNFPFVLSTSLGLLFIFHLLLRHNKKYYQALYIKRLENEANTLADYTKTVDSLYTDIRHYKHDIQNILLSMRFYIDQEDIEALRTFYYSEVLSLSPVSNPVYQIITNLQPLKHTSLKGLICSKIEDTARNNIRFQVEMLEPIEDIAVSAVDLCRIIGILLDNGIESASVSEAKELILSIDVQDSSVIFVIQNTFREKPEPAKMYQLNYSTKGENRGIGLHSLHAIIAKNKNISLSYQLDDQYFCHIITIKNL